MGQNYVKVTYFSIFCKEIKCSSPIWQKQPVFPSKDVLWRKNKPFSPSTQISYSIRSIFYVKWIAYLISIHLSWTISCKKSYTWHRWRLFHTVAHKKLTISRKKWSNSTYFWDSFLIKFQIRIRISSLDSGTRISDSNLDALLFFNWSKRIIYLQIGIVQTYTEKEAALLLNQRRFK